MENWKKFPRVILFLAALIGLAGGIAVPVQEETVNAAPMRANALDVIINEVAWGGTSASANDEWIELYNPTGLPIDLTGWRISDGGDINVNLVNTIPAYGYYLLERSNDYTVSNVAADLIYAGALADGGETLTLYDNFSNSIDTANGNGGGWPGGTNDINRYSMERENSSLEADASWSSNNGVIRNGLDAGTPEGCTPGVTCTTDPQQINGTPKQQNSSVEVDFSLSIDPLSTVASAGSPVSFTVTINNNSSTFHATGVDVNITLSGLAFVSATPSSGNYNSGIWNLPSLTNGSSATLTINATVLSSGSIDAQISGSDQIDPDLSNNVFSASVATPPTGNADLSITKTVNNANPNVNDSVVFSIAVSNAGPGVATNVRVRDLLPPGMSYVSHTSGETYSMTGFWNAGTVPVGTNTRILRITARVTSVGAKTNWAEIWSADQAPTDSRIYGNGSTTEVDDDDETVTPIGGIADLSLSLSYAKASPGTAGNIVLTITVTNDGPHNATNIIVRDKLPTGLTYVTDDGRGSYNKDTYLWSAGAVANGESKSLKITAKVDPTGTMINTAEIWNTDQADPDSTPGDGLGPDDYGSVTIASADLSITKSMDNVTPTVGTDVVFTIRVSNAGPDNATNVKVKDILPASYSYLSDDSATTSTTYNSNTTGTDAGVWNVGTLPSGASRSLKITATVITTTSSTFVNWAEVWASDQIDIDSVPGDSSRGSDDDASAPAADLRIDQTVGNSYPGLNTNFTYKVTVTNDGTVGTTGVQVKDKLPSGVSYVSHTSTVPVSGTTGTYTSSTGIWVVGNLANGASESLVITARMTTSGVRTNWAEVWRSNLPDPDSTPGNSSTTEDDDASSTVSFRPVIINEIAWAGTSSSLLDDQWIELYNPSSVAVNITGWTLRTSETVPTPSIVLNGTIASGGYFLLERDNNLTVSDITANQIYTGALSTSGEILTLRDTAGNVIDTANGNGGKWPAGGGTNYASMERQGNTAENDDVWVTNTGVTKNGKDANGGSIYGTPGKKNSTGIAPTATPVVVPPTAVPIVRPVINEFLARPGFDWNQDGKVDVFDEFIEIKNIGVTDVNLNGWKLDDEADQGSSPFTLPSITLKPGERAIFYGLQTNILLSDGGDTVRLLNPSNKIYDAYTYAIAKVEDRSVCRLPDGGSGWYEDCVPTPNLINSHEGDVPSMPEGEAFESPVCDLPDTLPADFLFAECRGYGAGIWRSFFWDQFGWQGSQFVRQNMSKWEAFVE